MDVSYLVTSQGFGIKPSQSSVSLNSFTLHSFGTWQRFSSSEEPRDPQLPLWISPQIPAPTPEEQLLGGDSGPIPWFWGRLDVGAAVILDLPAASTCASFPLAFEAVFVILAEPG